jgi:predicted neutral ceramidase superfamily lipid hydrolase
MDIREMALKNAAFWAFVGTLLVAALLIENFVVDAVAALRGLIPAMRIFSSLIYAFASVTMTVFFFVFYRNRAR